MKLQGSNILGQEQIDLLTTRGLNFVWFPKQLETIYRFQYQNGAAYEFRYRAPIILILGEFKHEVRQFEKSYDNQQAEQISLMV
ncbi:hypothetical protein DKE46_009815 [Acinetobacter pittii]|nr:hypothetical protein DKE46_009815 [Acinetobacter pittii]